MADMGTEAGVDGLWSTVERRVREAPAPALGVALLAGYVAGGGLFSKATRLLTRAALGAMLVPSFRARLLGAAEALRA
jgi:hypothetical protein